MNKSYQVYIYLAIIFVLALVLCQALTALYIYCMEHQKYQWFGLEEDDDDEYDGFSTTSRGDTERTGGTTVDDEESLSFFSELGGGTDENEDDYEEQDDKEVPSSPFGVPSNSSSNRRDNMESLLKALATFDNV